MVGVTTHEELWVRTTALQRDTIHRDFLTLLCEGKDFEDSQRITGFSFFGRNLRFCLGGYRGVLGLGNLHPHWLRLLLCKKQRIQACTNSLKWKSWFLIWWTEVGNS